MNPNHDKAFTLVEVIAALAIVSISLLALLNLHLLSISMVDNADITSRAVLLAQEKVAEKLAMGYPEPQTTSGTVQTNTVPFNWRTEIADVELPHLDRAQIHGLRQVSVEVTWRQGARPRRLQMSTYVADRKLSE